MLFLAADIGRGGRRAPRRSSRREVRILLPVALATLVALSTFTLFSYRSALALLADERREEAARLAGQIAGQLVAAPTPSAAELARLAPATAGVALSDARGGALAVSGDLPGVALLAPAGGVPIEQAVGIGPWGEAGLVTGLAPVPGGGEPRYLRVDLPAAVLATQLRGLKLLSVVVLAVNSALVLLVLFSLSQLLSPFERLLARARQVEERMGEPGGDRSDGKDEVEALLATFDRALAALAAAPAVAAERRPEEDVAALERTLAPSLQSGLLLLDREGAVLTVNQVAADLLGISPAGPATESSPPTTATPPTEPEPGAADPLARHPELARLLRAAVAGGREVQRQECEVEAGGARRTLGLSVHPLRRADGSPRGYLVLFADLTEARRRAEEERLAESLARVGELAAGVAHELRNGLATIHGYLTLIERRPDEESAAGFLAEIRRESEHLGRVLDDFLAFARPGTARVEELSLGALLRRAAADPALGPMEVRLAFPEGEPPRLRGDPQLLERALRNLLRNAAEAERAAGREGPIETAVRLTPEGIEVSIDDRGAGVPAELRGRLFHPFATGRPGGVGLGLALAQRILLLHGGRVRLEDRPGGGTRAVVSLPADTFVTEGSEPPAAEEATGPASAAL